MPTNDGTLPPFAPGRPVSLGSSWRYLGLTGDRLPLKGMTTVVAPGYWEGLAPDWSEINAWVGEGNAIGILPEKSGLVILDCDTVRAWQTEGNTDSMVRGHGLDDLKRVAAQCEQMITPTFTVKTKSDGYHLYYAQNPLCPVTSRGHRDGWRIDVKASPNTFAVAPPTPGYSVVRDIPVAELPLWLAQWVQGLYKALDPVGGAGQRRRMDLAVAMKHELLLNGSGQEPNLYLKWCNAMLNVVAASNQYGGWNNAVYLTAHEFFDVGMSVADVLPMIMESAAPHDAREERTVANTVESAWRKHLDGSGYGYTESDLYPGLIG